jgi:predicted metal-binding protein
METTVIAPEDLRAFRRVPRKIQLKYPDEIIAQDLQKYCQQAIEFGATDAKIISTDTIPIDERVQLKCRVPVCFGYNTSANCPPHTIAPATLREIIGRYKHAILLKLEVQPRVIVRDRTTIIERVNAYKKVFELVSTIESMAFYDGYYLAMGFAAGSCKSTYCYKVDCAVLRGERCRNELLVRPSMESVGIDTYKLATRVGWEIYPIGSACRPDAIPHAALVGLILIY